MTHAAIETANVARKRLVAYINKAEDDYALFGAPKFGELCEAALKAAAALDGASMPSYELGRRTLKEAEAIGAQRRAAERETERLCAQLTATNTAARTLRREATILKHSVPPPPYAPESEWKPVAEKAEAMHRQADGLVDEARQLMDQIDAAKKAAKGVATREAAARGMAVSLLGDALAPSLVAAECRVAVARAKDRAAINTCAGVNELVACSRGAVSARRRVVALQAEMQGLAPVAAALDEVEV